MSKYDKFQVFSNNLKNRFDNAMLFKMTLIGNFSQPIWLHWWCYILLAPHHFPFCVHVYFSSLFSSLLPPPLGMWMMLQRETPEDFVLATGETHSVRQFVQLAFQEIGKEIVWEGQAENEVGKDKQTGQVLIKVRLWYCCGNSL